MKNILVLEDNVEINEILSNILKRNNYNVFSTFNGFEAMDVFREQKIDCIITDLVLPIMSGERFIFEIRKLSNVHIIIISTKMTLEEKLEGLRVGADDFLVKPFSNDEILIKLKNLFDKQSRNDDLISINNGDIQFNKGQPKLIVLGQEIELTAIEYYIFLAFSTNINKVLSRAQIIDFLYKNEKHVTDRIVDTHVKNIRKKISEFTDANLIKTVYGLGYALEGTIDE